MQTMYRKMRFNTMNIEYEILFDFVDKATERTFVIYTDYSINKYAQTQLFAALCCEEKTGKLSLVPIVSESDWQLVERELHKFLSGGA